MTETTENIGESESPDGRELGELAGGTGASTPVPQALSDVPGRSPGAMMPEVSPALSTRNAPQPFQLFEALPAHIEDALRASIQRFGVLVPIAKDQHGNILDGHHRERIAREVGVQPRYDRIVVEDEDQAREIAQTLNADRRQLTEEQRRPIVAALIAENHSQRAIAGALGVSQSTVRDDVLSIRDEVSTATHLGTRSHTIGTDGKVYPGRRPAIVAAKNEREDARAQQALDSLGDATPATGVFDVKRTERIARETEADRRRAEPVSPQTVDGIVDIRHGDFREVLADIPGGTVDAIITDPPYPGEFIGLFEDLSHLAARVLKHSGVLAVMCGQYYLPEYIARLSAAMRYRWCGAYIAQGPRTRIHAAKVGTGWKPILVFQRHGVTGDDLTFILDDLFDSAGDDKRHHHWGQSESGTGDLVERLTRPDALVVDPFLGGGTTAVVCRDLGRRFIGCDLDAAHVTTSLERLA